MNSLLSRFCLILLVACMSAGCTALLTGGKKQPAKTAALENLSQQTQCDNNNVLSMSALTPTNFVGIPHGY